jgi:hypothetical protein
VIKCPECERLVESLSAHYSGVCPVTFDALKAENERLREALVKVKPIVGAAVAGSSNKARPLREAAYAQLVAALAVKP